MNLKHVNLFEPPPPPQPEETSGPDGPDELPSSYDPPHRVPNLGHAMLFVCFAGMLLVIIQTLCFLVWLHPAPGAKAVVSAMQHPKLLLGSQAATYLAAIASSVLFFPYIWNRPFFSGIQWHWQTARDQFFRLVGLGLSLGFLVQLALYFVSPPDKLPMDQMFASRSDAWLITFFGIFIAPAFEEICFRGFLVPAFAIAYDWIILPRTPVALERWRSSTTLTPMALLFSAVLSSILFALLHAEQVALLIPALAVFFCVSLVLTFVRIRTRSVACSTIVHAAYNSFIFIALLIQTGGYRHLDRLTR